MTRSFKEDKRKSFVSMYQYDMSELSQSSRYHARYLKMVGITIALTFIGILIFIRLQKPDALNSNVIENYQMPDNVSRPEFFMERQNEHKSPTKKPSQLIRSHGFQKRQWKTIGYAKTSKQNELRQHLKQIQVLLTDLKYFPQ